MINVSNKQEIKTKTIETTFLPPEIKQGWGNGYVGVPPNHPWFGKDYNELDVDVHGGLTFSNKAAPKEQPDSYWWIGFDTCHYQDNKYNCSKEYVEQQTQQLKEQAE